MRCLRDAIQACRQVCFIKGVHNSSPREHQGGLRIRAAGRLTEGRRKGAEARSHREARKRRSNHRQCVCECSVQHTSQHPAALCCTVHGSKKGSTHASGEQMAACCSNSSEWPLKNALQTCPAESKLCSAAEPRCPRCHAVAEKPGIPAGSVRHSSRCWAAFPAPGAAYTRDCRAKLRWH